MLKHLWFCGAFLAVGTGSLHAQVREAVLEKIAVPGAAFHLLVAVPKSGGRTLHVSPEAAYIPLVGGELALAFETWEEFLRTLDELRWPVAPIRVERRDGISPAAVYIVPVPHPGVAIEYRAHEK